MPSGFFTYSLRDHIFYILIVLLGSNGEKPASTMLSVYIAYLPALNEGIAQCPESTWGSVRFVIIDPLPVINGINFSFQYFEMQYGID
jgi:hypothetical protein